MAGTLGPALPIVTGGPHPLPESNTATAGYDVSAVGSSPGADVDLTGVFKLGWARELIANGGGTVVAWMKDDTSAHTYTLIAGLPLGGAFTKVVASGTTATGIVARV